MDCFTYIYTFKNRTSKAIKLILYFLQIFGPFDLQTEGIFKTKLTYMYKNRGTTFK